MRESAGGRVRAQLKVLAGETCRGPRGEGVGREWGVSRGRIDSGPPCKGMFVPNARWLFCSNLLRSGIKKFHSPDKGRRICRGLRHTRFLGCCSRIHGSTGETPIPGVNPPEDRREHASFFLAWQTVLFNPAGRTRWFRPSSGEVPGAAGLDRSASRGV